MSQSVQKAPQAVEQTQESKNEKRVFSMFRGEEIRQKVAYSAAAIVAAGTLFGGVIAVKNNTSGNRSYSEYMLQNHIRSMFESKDVKAAKAELEAQFNQPIVVMLVYEKNNPEKTHIIYATNYALETWSNSDKTFRDKKSYFANSTKVNILSNSVEFSGHLQNADGSVTLDSVGFSRNIFDNASDADDFQIQFL